MRVAIVTGASSGIGKSVALSLARGGWHVVLVARRLTELLEVQKEIKNLGGSADVVSADVSQLSEIEGAVAKAREVTGDIDALINVAGLGHAHSIMTPSELTELVIAVNLTAPIHFMREVLPGMVARGSGAIVNIGSVAGEVGVSGIYSATKFGLRGVTDSVRREVYGSGVTISLVEPGWIDTPLTSERATRMPGPEIVAIAVEKALRRSKRRLIVPWTYRPSTLLGKVLPAFTDRLYAGKAIDGDLPITGLVR
jgi:short-subunit dehydrogenase